MIYRTKTVGPRHIRHDVPRRIVVIVAFLVCRRRQYFGCLDLMVRATTASIYVAALEK
jgi:hypothetical protein